ncbi:hypothetical protein [Paenisporosarcina sp. NPDC076898]|uniref:hypothetical protein n=1 Tax=unclassified Paenisporosarcina TaxID=2642018 RepID=UPI003D079D18
MKKLLSIALALVIAGATIFTPINVEAASISKAETLVIAAEKQATALKWQISFELTKQVKYPDMKVFNLTKDAYLKAKKELLNVNAKDRVLLEKRLEANVGIHYTRAIAYIDAITNGMKMVDKANQFNKQYAADPTAITTEKSYHELSGTIRKNAMLLYRVYGKTTRDAILKTYKAPGEKAILSAQDVITAKMNLNKMNLLISAKANKETVETQVSVFIDSLDAIEDEEIIDVLYTAYQTSIRNDSNFIAQEKELIEFFTKSDAYYNEEKLEETFGLYSEEYPDYVNLKEGIQSTFEEFDVVYETLGLEVQYIIDGTAVVTQDQKATIDQTEEYSFTYTYLIEKDDAGNWKYLDTLDVY